MTFDDNSTCLYINIENETFSYKYKRKYFEKENYRTRFGSRSLSLITAQLVKESSSVGHFVATS